MTKTAADQPVFRRVEPATRPAVAFAIDGVAASAAEGDLLITALLLNRSRVRRFEFGPGGRAGFCMMGACQDCWVTLADGRRLRACTTLVEPGMNVLVDGAADGR